MDKEKFANCMLEEFFDDENFTKRKSYKYYEEYFKKNKKFCKNLNDEQLKQYFECDDLLWKYVCQREVEIFLFGLQNFKDVNLS